MTDSPVVRPLFVTAGEAALWLRVHHDIDVDAATIRQWAQRHNILVRAGGGQARYDLRSVVQWAKSSERNARAARRQLGISRHRVPVPEDVA